MSNLNEEIEIIINTLNSNIENLIDEYENFHVGKFVELPNQCGCFKRNSQWYIYNIDERNFCTFTGPFSINGIIYACAKLLHIAKKFKSHRFSKNELEIYLNNNFHSFAEIDKLSKR